MGSKVELFIYDLSKGFATLLSSQILGRQIDGIWHTSIVVFEREHYFGSRGIETCPVGGTILGNPLEKLELGETFVTYSLFREYLQGLEESTFKGSQYNLLQHNCNNFSNEVAQFLVGVTIPKYILDLPAEVLESPIGQTFLNLNQQLHAGAISRGREYSPDFLQLNSAIEEVRRSSIALDEKRNELHEKLARKERKKKKKIKKEEREKERILQIELELEKRGYQFRPLPVLNNQHIMAEAATNGDTNGEKNGVIPEVDDITQVTKKARDVVAEIEEEEKRELEELRKKQRDPPVVFKDALDVRIEFDALVGLIDGQISPEEQRSLEELHQYMLEDEGSWALGDSFLLFIGRLLHDRTLPPEVRVRTLHVLAIAALKDDVILLLHQDRREHVLMNYAGDVEKLTLEEQQALALFFANLFEHLSSSEWLLYISEWQFCNSTLSNIRVTTKVAVNALLSDVPTLQDRGTAIIHNMACKEVKTVVFDDVAVELTMALLQFLNSSPQEEQLFRVLKSLARFCGISGQDVPQLIQMIGPDPTKFKGVSPRIDEQITAISAKLR